MASGARTRTPVTLRLWQPQQRFAFKVAVSSTAASAAVAKHLHGLTTRFLAAARQSGHPTERLQHLLHLHELLQQTIHVFDRRAAALRDALPSIYLGNERLPPLLRAPTNAH